MELRDLRYFVTLAEQEHFTKAATILHITQPTLSHQIRKLETQLGAELFHRTKRSVRLTGAGRAVLIEARSLLSQAKITSEVARLAASGEVGDMTIGFIEAAVFSLLPRLISQFRARYPKVALKLRELSTEEQIEALGKRTIDIGVLRGPIRSTDIETKHVMRESLVVALPRSHRLARSSTVHLRALRDESFIIYARPRANRLRDEIVGACRSAGFLPSIVQEAQEFHTLCGLVAAGLGVSLLPSSAGITNIRGVVYRRVTAPDITVDYLAAWYKNARTPALRAFQSTL